MPSERTKTRVAGESDLPEIAAIYNHEVRLGTATFDTEPKSVDEVRSWLLGRGPTHPAIVAITGPANAKKTVGFAALYPWSPRAAYSGTAENTVYLNPDYRGQGIGIQLLESVLELGKAAGLHTVLARITTGNHTSLELHRKLGFKKVGTLKEVGRKFGQFLDVDLLQLVFDSINSDKT